MDVFVFWSLFVFPVTWIFMFFISSISAADVLLSLCNCKILVPQIMVWGFEAELDYELFHSPV